MHVKAHECFWEVERMEEELYQELFERDKDIAELHAKIFELTQENVILKNSVTTLLKKNNKRGEASYMLSIPLHEALKQNLETVDLKMYRQPKTQDAVALLVLHLLIGDRKKDVPVAMHDKWNVIYLHNVSCYVVVSVEEFTEYILSAIKDSIVRKIEAFVNEDSDEEDMHVVNIIQFIMEPVSFVKSVRTALKLYEMM